MSKGFNGQLNCSECVSTENEVCGYPMYVQMKGWGLYASNSDAAQL